MLNSPKVKADVDFIMGKLQTELILHEKLMDALEELKRAKNVCKEMDRGQRGVLRSVQELELLSDGLAQCMICFPHEQRQFFENLSTETQRML